MSLADRLRSESAAVRVDPSPALAGRISAAIRAAGPAAPAARPPLVFPWRPVLAAAAAALLVAALATAWPSRPQPVAPSQFATVPVPPALETIVAAVPRSGPLHTELAAIGVDLAAAARAVRGTVPF